MKRMRWIRALCVMLVLCMTVTGGVFASEEPAAGSAEEICPEEADAKAENDAGETAAEITGVPAEEAEPEEPPIPGEEDGDPMALRRAMQVDGGTKRYSDFTTRALNNETLRKGVDVSNWQGSINWKKAAADGVEFAIIRAAYRTYGSGALYKDSYFDANIRGAQAAGIRVGVYIFSQAITKKEAREEADFILKMVKGYDIDLPLVFDLEHYAGGRFSNAGLSRRQITDIFKAFCARIEKVFGQYAIVVEMYETRTGKMCGSFAERQPSIDSVLSSMEKNYMKIFGGIEGVKKRGEPVVAQVLSEAVPPKGTKQKKKKEIEYVEIGGLRWMKRNLNSVMPNSWCYDDDDFNCRGGYGRLYVWESALQACPEGWRLPSRSEAEYLISSLGKKAGQLLKAEGEWESGTSLGSYGFSALPAGHRGSISRGDYGGRGDETAFWTSTLINAKVVYGLHIGKKAAVKKLRRDYGYSIRCVGNIR